MTETPTRKFDYHVHYSTFTDQIARESAIEVINKSKESGVSVIALLSRGEIVDFFNEFTEYGANIKPSIEVIPAIEDMVRLNGKRVDVVFLGFDPNHPSIQKHFGREPNRRKNSRIAAGQRDFLQEIGFSYINLSPDDQGLYELVLSGQTVEKAIRFCEIAVSQEGNISVLERLKKENANLWDETLSIYANLPNYLNDARKLNGKFLFQLFFRVGCPGMQYVEEKVGPLQEKVFDALNAVHEAGGVVLYSPEGEFDLNIWEKLKNEGIDGIMAWHADYLGKNRGKEDVPLEIITKEHRDGYLILGGSDFQGLDWEIGTGNNGRMQIGKRRHEELIRCIKSRNNGRLPWKK